MHSKPHWRYGGLIRLTAGCAMAFGLAVLLQAPAMSAEWWVSAGVEAVLNSPDSSQLLARQYPVDNLRLDLVIWDTAPGVILDTAGIGPAIRGDFTLLVSPDGYPQLNVYAPDVTSPVQAPNGWHVFRGATKLKANDPYWLTVVVKDGDIGLVVDERIESKETVPVALSGNAVYLGDTPSDDYLGAGFDIHRSCQAKVRVVYFGPFCEKISADLLGQSVIKPQGAQPSESGNKKKLKDLKFYAWHW